MACTLQGEIEFSGVGLHSGESSKVLLRPCGREGIFFRTPVGDISISTAVVDEDNRLTGFRLRDGTKVRTAEHLLGAIVGMGLEGVIIELDGEEVPIFDGSAYPFAQKISETGTVEVGECAVLRHVSAPVVVDEPGSGRFVAALPSGETRITYVIDYPDVIIGTQRTSFVITEKSFLDIIAKARTFGLVSELDYLKNNGLAKGGSLDNAMLFDGERILNEGGLRFPLEAVTHKVTDLLGDLALLGFLPRAHYVAICAGHGIHGRLTDRLRRIFIRDI